MVDPRPLTRKELSKFLPTQRSIRAFEKLFDLVPPELEDILLIAESALLSSQFSKTENSRLRQQMEELQLEVLTLKNRLSASDQLAKRVEMIETLQG